jgi:hypothetical protein
MNDAAQATLPDVDTAPPQTSAPPRGNRHDTLCRHLDEGEPLQGALGGLLAEGARLLTDSDDGTRVIVQVLVQQHVALHPQVWPLLAEWHYPNHCGPAVALQRAVALVARLPAGTEVVVCGRGVEAWHHAGKPCLRLMDTRGIAPRQDLEPQAVATPDLFAPGGASPC